MSSQPRQGVEGSGDTSTRKLNRLMRRKFGTCAHGRRSLGTTDTSWHYRGFLRTVDSEIHTFSHPFYASLTPTTTIITSLFDYITSEMIFLQKQRYPFLRAFQLDLHTSHDGNLDTSMRLHNAAIAARGGHAREVSDYTLVLLAEQGMGRRKRKRRGGGQ